MIDRTLVRPAGCAVHIAPRPISIGECRRYTMDSVPDSRDGPSNFVLMPAFSHNKRHCDQRPQVGCE